MPNDKTSFRHRALVESLATPKARVTLDELPMPFDPVELTGGVTEQEERFLRHWVSHSYGKPKWSAVAAGYPEVTAQHKAWGLLSQARIQNRLAEIERELFQSTNIDAETLFREVVTQNLRLARARVPVQVWNPPCRYCHGDNHEYQRTHAEFERDWKSHINKPIKLSRHSGKPIRIPIFDPEGGSGYDETLPPHPDCPECRGEGDTKHPIVKIKDSRFFTAEERELFHGAEMTKAGVKTIWKDQAHARSFLNDLALRMTEHRRPEDAIDITEMSADRLKQFLMFAKEQGFDVDPEALEDVAE
jgi:phage terminase small subunit